MKSIFKSSPIIAILRNMPDALLIPYVNSIIKGGITTFEVAMNTPNGAKQIQKIKDTFGDSIVIGAGTAITIEQIEEAHKAGAQFFLTPSVNEKLLAYFKKNQLDVLPGIMTPSDVDLCLTYGYHTMKLFPAGDLPLSYIKSLKGPFQNTNYIAVGGVNVQNIASFFQAGFLGVGIGSCLIPPDFVALQNWDGATSYIQKSFSAFL